MEDLERGKPAVSGWVEGPLSLFKKPVENFPEIFGKVIDVPNFVKESQWDISFPMIEVGVPLSLNRP